MSIIGGDARSSLDEISLTIDRACTAKSHLNDVRYLYERVYAEPPYLEGPDDVEDFISGWPARQGQPSFRLVIAWHEANPVGFTFGHALSARTAWWQGLQGAAPAELTHEYERRTFAVIELAVLQPYRRHGIGNELHSHLLAGLPHDRATLLVRPDAEAAQRAYRSWGYHRVGQIQPFADAPIYDAMILDLRADPRLTRQG